MPRSNSVFPCVLAAISLAACSPSGDDAEPQRSSAPSARVDSASGETVALAELTGDAEAGRKVFARCRSCHVLEAGANRVGPSLAGVVGRQAGTAPGFSYSAAMKSSGLVWSEDELFRYLENPRRTLPGTKMSFAGLRDAQDRADVIAYLKAGG